MFFFATLEMNNLIELKKKKNRPNTSVMRPIDSELKSEQKLIQITKNPNTNLLQINLDMWK